MQFPPDLVAVKLGGSLITDKLVESCIRRQILRRVAKEIADLTRRGTPLIVAHGSGSYGHHAAVKHDVCTAAGASAVQAAAHALHMEVMSALREAGCAAFSLPPAAAYVDGRPITVEPIARALAAGCTPVLLGDVVMMEQGAAVASTEDLLLGAVRAGLRLSSVVWLGVTDGVLDNAGITVPVLDRAALHHLGSAVGPSNGPDVTGGMRHRVAMALDLAELGVTSLVTNGETPGVLRSWVDGVFRNGTIIEGQKRAD